MKETRLFGVAINDADYVVKKHEYVEGKRKSKWVCPFYRKWSNMITRSCSESFQEKSKRYVGSSCCDEWLRFSTFKAWMESQEWEGKELDKDLLVEGNMRYSPDKCLMVSHEVNSFLVMSNSIRGDFPVGVCFFKRDKNYHSYIKKSGKRMHIGYFDTPQLAHQAWQKKKLELAIELQSRQDDDRVRKGLQRVIDKLDFHIKNGIETVSL